MSKWINASQHGVLKVEGKTVKVYHQNHDYTNILLMENVKDVRWAGQSLVVTMESGKVRRYSDYGSFVNI